VKVSTCVAAERIELSDIVIDGVLKVAVWTVATTLQMLVIMREGKESEALTAFAAIVAAAEITGEIIEEVTTCVLTAIATDWLEEAPP